MEHWFNMLIWTTEIAFNSSPDLKTETWTQWRPMLNESIHHNFPSMIWKKEPKCFKIMTVVTHSSHATYASISKLPPPKRLTSLRCWEIHYWGDSCILETVYGFLSLIGQIWLWGIRLLSLRQVLWHLGGWHNHRRAKLQ